MPCTGTYVSDDLGCAHWREKAIAARKPHVCCECGDKIAVGERCDFATGLYDGKWERWWRCWSCAVLAELIATVTGYCPLWGGLSEEDLDEVGVDWFEWRDRARGIADATHRPG